MDVTSTINSNYTAFTRGDWELNQAHTTVRTLGQLCLALRCGVGDLFETGQVKLRPQDVRWVGSVEYQNRWKETRKRARIPLGWTGHVST